MSDISSSRHRLVGKFFTTNSTPPPSLDETEESLRKQWNLSDEDMTVQKLDEGSDTFLFTFRQEIHKRKALCGGPYYVNGVIIVIKNNPATPDTIIDFTVASFIVGIVGLPLYLYMEEYYPTLKSLVGDMNNTKVLPGEMISCVMEVDLKKPLKAGFYVEQNWFVQLKYRSLGTFCYNCGMIGHVKRRCDQVRFPKERALTATSRTHVYGPWLRFSPTRRCYELVPMTSPEKQSALRECEKTLSYAQFFIELEFRDVIVCNPRSKLATNSTHKFRFPCSYLDLETESMDSKAYEVIRKEIYENTPFSLDRFGEISESIKTLVEKLKVIKESEFCCDDKWLTLKLQVNRKNMITHVDYETVLAVHKDRDCERLIQSKISDLIKKRVQNNEDLLSLSSWKSQIEDVISEMGFSSYMYNVSQRAKKAMTEAVEMEFSNNSMIPADRSMVVGLNRYKLLGSDMERLYPCVVCAEEMFLAEEVTALPCSHVFHSSCIDKWLQVGHKCPLCGFRLLSQN